MAEHHWNQLQKRLKNIIDPKLNIKFNNSPVRKKTSWDEITIRFFQVILDDEIIWQFPKDTNQQKDSSYIYGQYKIDKYNFKNLEFPIMSIINYLDLPKDKILDYQDKAGLSDILKVCDKRIGFNRLKPLQLSKAAQKIFNKRFEHKIQKNENLPRKYKTKLYAGLTKENFYFVGTTLSQKRTGLNMLIFVCPNFIENLSPRIWVQNDYKNHSSSNILPVDIETQTISKYYHKKPLNLTNDDLTQLKQFILLNRKLLIEVCRQEPPYSSIEILEKVKGLRK